jgi:hypothetical protein
MASRIAIVAGLLLLAAPALAQEPVGCDKFRWPVEKEMAALRAGGLPQVSSGIDVAAASFVGTLALRAPQDAGLPTPPERAPKQGTSAGFVSFKGVPAGIYSISLSAPGWLDVAQGGHFLKAKAFGGVQGCDGIRKVVKFELSAEPFVVQISNVEADHIAIAVMPAAE